MASKYTPDAHDVLVRDVLNNSFGREVSDVWRNPQSNNTNIYVLTLEEVRGNKADSGRKQPAQPGIVALPLNATKVVMRIPDPGANLNDAVRVQSEVAAMALGREALKPLGSHVVPAVYGWRAASRDETGWVLMEFLPGARLGAADLKKLGPDATKAVLEQIALVFRLIQQYEVPVSTQGYGGLGFADDGSITVGPTPIHGATKRCETYHELYTQYFHTQLAFMDKCDIVKVWRDTDLRARIDDFAARGFKPLLERASEPKPCQTLIHGDLDLHNLLFDPTTHRLTAVLDWDFSHVALAADEYFYSFDAIGGLVPPPARDPQDAQSRRRHSLLHGYDDGGDSVVEHGRTGAAGEKDPETDKDGGLQVELSKLFHPFK